LYLTETAEDRLHTFSLINILIDLKLSYNTNSAIL